MKLLISAALLISTALSGLSRSDVLTPGQIHFWARSQTTDGALRSLQGDVRIETASVLIRADKAVFNTDNSEVQAAGNVHVTLKQ